MPVRHVDPENRGERKRFVSLEDELVGAEPLFVAEVASEVHKRARGRSPFYEEMEHALFVASNGRDVARCAAFVNRRWQRDNGDAAGFIGYFAAAPGVAAEVGEMLEAAERWLGARGARKAIAPFNGAAFHGLATLTDAFNEEPMFPFPWQPPYYPGLLEGAGYRPAYPETFREEWEFHAMTSEEFHEFLDPIKPVLDQRQFLFAEVDSEPAGFCFGLPDWTPLFRSFKGKMGPMQILRLLLRAKRYTRAGLIAIGVRDSQRGKHIGGTLASTLYSRYEELGLSGALYYPVNDHNLASRRLAESFGGRGRILYHAYDKPLALS